MCGRSSRDKSTNQRGTPAGSSIRHRKQVEPPSLNDLSVNSSGNGIGIVMKSR